MISDEVAGNRNPVGAIIIGITVITIIAVLFSVVCALPMIADMRAMVTVSSDSAAIIIDDTGTHETGKTRMRLSNLDELFAKRDVIMMGKWQVASGNVVDVVVIIIMICIGL